MTPTMAHAEDGACWETVLRFLQTPSPADYSFEFASDPRVEEEAQPFEENLVVDEYLFRPHSICLPRQIVYNKPQNMEVKQAAKDAVSEVIQKPINPAAKFLKLTEVEMVQSLRRWKQLTQELHSVTPCHPVTIEEADVYALHPAELVSGSCTHYFYSSTKYSCLKRPTRLRITENGCRWKQQGRIFPIRENGQTVAYKTYLSYVALKNGNNLTKKLSAPPHTDESTAAVSKDGSCTRRDRKWSLWTMEEVGLADDIQSERVILRRGGRPRPFPVICRIICKRDGSSSGPLQERAKCPKKSARRDSQVDAKLCKVETRTAASPQLVKHEKSTALYKRYDGRL